MATEIAGKMNGSRHGGMDDFDLVSRKMKDVLAKTDWRYLEYFGIASWISFWHSQLEMLTHRVRTGPAANLRPGKRTSDHH